MRRAVRLVEAVEAAFGVQDLPPEPRSGVTDEELDESDLEAGGVGLRSLTESIDTTTATGRLVFAVFAAMAEFERDLIRERTAAGLASARAQGRTGGRPAKMTPEKLAAARHLFDTSDLSMAGVAATIGVSRTTPYRHLGAGDRGPI